MDSSSGHGTTLADWSPSTRPSSCDIVHCSTRCFPSKYGSMVITLLLALVWSITMASVSASGFFELQFHEGVRNSTTINVCLKEFWKSQTNYNRCTFGQKTIIYNQHNHPLQSVVKIPFSFRWIVSPIRGQQSAVISHLNSIICDTCPVTRMGRKGACPRWPSVRMR